MSSLTTGQELRPHQKTALRKLSTGKILWGGVGSGKSRVAVEYYMEYGEGLPIVVITTAKKRDSLDWDREFAAKSISRDMDGKDGTIAPLIIDSWNNLSKYVDLVDCFFIFDDRKNTRWHKADIRTGRKGSVSRKPNGAYRKCTAHLRGLPPRALELRLGATETGANEAWYHSSIMP